ncbi:putative secreted protein [Methylophaga frappieri]|uniref:Putative secreted protein n=1 Tax=Methylophaga frappieri (strain ATCC BAA-2434 / DSM 25690 / JAM7) TaxID=754477 RepID=I1YK97_METFJ|nr:quinoprotein dehydrogenase-associated SoxYZ-like carrier [Methylophaga frappieri]AFJ03340.1 putative secreted protein [Methylophaga frappieri]
MFKRFCLLIVSICVSLTLPAQADTPKEPMWPILKEIHFEGRDIREDANDLISLDAPKRAEDAAIVPITIKLLKPQTETTYIKNIHLIIDNNPDPYSANFHLNPEMTDVEISTRVRVDQYTDMRVIAEMNDNSLHMVSRFVKASGGCSAPAGKDAAAAQARLGQMQIRMRQPQLNEPVHAQVIVSHPNYSGLQFDQKNRRYINAHYVDHIDIQFNGKSLIQIDAGISISEDPSVRFVFTPREEGTLKAFVRDSKDMTFNSEKTI